jgi:hypothetical protein
VQRKAALKWYWKYENSKEVQRQWQNGFGTQPPTRRTIARIRDKFVADGTVHDVHKRRSGRPRIVTSPASSAVVLQHFTRSPQKSVNQCARESGVSRSSVRRILRAPKWKVYIPRLPSIKLEICGQLLHSYIMCQHDYGAGFHVSG